MIVDRRERNRPRVFRLHLSKPLTKLPVSIVYWMARRLAGFFVLLASMWSCGCMTHAKRVASSRDLFYSGRMEECRSSLEKLSSPLRHDRDVVQLDLAMATLLDGEAKKAESLLKETRDRFLHLEKESMAEKALSMWTDDKARAYAGESYEKILIHAFLALANLMHDGGDAESHTLQLQSTHERLLQKVSEKSQTKISYQPLPFGFYLRGLLREATLRDYDDAARNYNAARELMPDCIPLQWDCNRAVSGVHSQPGHGVIYVLALVGKGPYKVEVTEEPTSDALLIADRIVSAVGPYHLPPTIAPIKIPDIAVPHNDLDAVAVSVNGTYMGPTFCVANVRDLALETYRAEKNVILARAVARRVIKKATVVAAKEKVAEDGLTRLGMDLAGVAWEALESADTRCWGLLPSQIQVLRIEAAKGTARVDLSPTFAGRLAGPRKTISVDVRDGANTYVLAWFPDTRSPGQVISNEGQLNNFTK